MTFEWSVIWDAMPSLLEGTKMTVKITLLGLIGGTILGFLAGVITTYVKVLVTWKTTAIAVVSIVALYILLRLASWLGDTVLSGVPDWAWLTLQIVLAVLLLVRFAAYIPVALSFLAQVYILVIRGTPIVVQVMFIYFALPLIFGWRIDAVLAAIFTLVINSGAYISEIVRGALLSVPKGLKEAGQAMGLPFYKILAYIIGPVALRRMIPAMGNQCIISLKDSSLFIVIGVAELTRQGQEIIASNFRSVEIWGAVAVLYLILTGFIALTLKFIEHRTQIV
ncbi:amino acid ABC transporter, permease protein, His/Glu/Gln/Arg/opine family [Pusillimonas sp. T7-7]|uniref:ABC transporter permease subunit n=1 Tax=Pusillimonas sp. (strain T7-7) TaxID=1007105 RepID=UPI000208565C|nr:amino acid ABC transporter, permease protein, His/Glu/Gln/Arg/opine family [Pusillimonas sp. T7-7]